MMTTEEKASAYDMAIDRAKNLMLYKEEVRKKDIQYLFPELKNNDEKVRKALVKVVEDVDSGYPFEKYGIIKKEALAWLEKQVQVKESPEIQHENKTCEENADSLTRNNEQKPTDDIDAAKASEEYRKYRVSCGITDPVMLDEIEEAYYEGAIRQKSAEWSEKDEDMLDDIINDYEIRASLADEFSIVKNNSLIKVHWLKSLRPQNRWKPTKEQLRELRCAISGCSVETSILLQLEEDLKKLKD